MKPDQPRISNPTVAEVPDPGTLPTLALPYGWRRGLDIAFVLGLVRSGPKRGAKSMKMAIGLLALLALAACGVPVVPLI